MMIKYIQAEFLKMRKFPVVLAHLLIPVIVSVVFLAYYSGTSYSEESKVEAFFETLGFGLPILIGIFAACIAELEENAGELQKWGCLRSERWRMVLHRQDGTQG